jgi:hypothetical protein
MTRRTLHTAAELYQLAQAQTLIDLYESGTLTDEELAKHHDQNGKIIPTTAAFEKIMS